MRFKLYLGNRKTNLFEICFVAKSKDAIMVCLWVINIHNFHITWPSASLVTDVKNFSTLEWRSHWVCHLTNTDMPFPQNHGLVQTCVQLFDTITTQRTQRECVFVHHKQTNNVNLTACRKGHWRFWIHHYNHCHAVTQMHSNCVELNLAVELLLPKDAGWDEPFYLHVGQHCSRTWLDSTSRKVHNYHPLQHPTHHLT